jgi:hypothetical protein
MIPSAMPLWSADPRALDQKVAQQRAACDRLRDTYDRIDRDSRNNQAQADATAAQIQRLEAMTPPLVRRVKIADLTGKIAAGCVLGGLAVGSVAGFIPGAAMLFVGLAGFAASYLWQFKNRAKCMAIDGAENQLDRQRQQLQSASAEAARRREEIGQKLESARSELRTLEMARVAQHANAGPDPDAVKVEEQTVRIGPVRVPRNPSAP